MPQTIDKETHRALAASLFNETWRLLDLPSRSPEQDVLMIHSAHASRLHWEVSGNATNKAVGEWQIARVYSVLGLAESALYHAKLCLELGEQNPGFHLGCAHEAMARALSLTDKQQARFHHAAATEILDQDPERS